MPDPKILLQSGEFYHIWTHANGNENLFREEKNYAFFLRKYVYYIQPIADTFAYCLMPNHLHLMVRIKGEDEVLEYIKSRKSDPNLQGFENLGGFSRFISQQFSNLFNSYTKALNKHYNRKGSLFIPNFNRKHIQSDSYFTTLIAYIHNNPVHHGFVDRPEYWPHSSLPEYIQNLETKVKREETMSWFGGLNEFLKMHRQQSKGKWTSLFEE